MDQMYKPFLVPHTMERFRGNFPGTGGEIRAPERVKPILRSRCTVRISRIDRNLRATHHQEGGEVCLVQHIIMGIRREPSAVVQITPNGIILQTLPGADSILDLEKGGRI